MLPSKDRRPFAGKVHDLKKKHLDNMVMDGKLPLRPGQLSTLYPQLLAIRNGADTVSFRKHTACTAEIIALSDTECYTTLGTATDEHCMLSCLLQRTLCASQWQEVCMHCSGRTLNMQQLPGRHSRLHRRSSGQGRSDWTGRRHLLHSRRTDHDSSLVCPGRGAQPEASHLRVQPPAAEPGGGGAA